MNELEIFTVTKESIITLLKVVSPIIGVALGVGLVIGIFQALTQIQEMTLAFVPKIICVFLALVLLFPFMFGQMQTLSESLFARIAAGG